MDQEVFGIPLSQLELASGKNFDLFGVGPQTAAFGALVSVVPHPEVDSKDLSFGKDYMVTFLVDNS